MLHTRAKIIVKPPLDATNMQRLNKWAQKKNRFMRHNNRETKRRRMERYVTGYNEQDRGREGRDPAPGAGKGT